VRARVREEAGFGLIELLIAITMLNIGILALVGAFNSGAIALGRASKISNAATLADSQMELFRGLKYSAIAQDCSEWNGALGDSTFTADRAYETFMKPQGSPATTPKPLVPSVTDNSCTTTSPSPAPVASATICPGTGSPRQVPAACDPSRLVTGADHRSYRIDTYLYYDTPSTGRQLKVITVAVRDADATGRSLARLTSTFDASTGS
jgi:type II secretory pathway pseudopilin PulG